MQTQVDLYIFFMIMLLVATSYMSNNLTKRKNGKQ